MSSSMLGYRLMEAADLFLSRDRESLSSVASVGNYLVQSRRIKNVARTIVWASKNESTVESRFSDRREEREECPTYASITCNG